MLLYLIRHGETEYNRDGRGLGRADLPLNERGQAQAAALGRRFAGVALGRVFSSPLGRALAVAAAVANGRVTVETRDELLELDVGETEGLPFAEMRQQYPEFLREWGGERPEGVRMPGGESLRDVAERLEPFLKELHQLEEAAVAVVAHNFVNRIAICRLLGLEINAFRSFGTDVASVSTLAVEHGRVAVISLNDTCHLRVESSPV